MKNWRFLLILPLILSFISSPFKAQATSVTDNLQNIVYIICGSDINGDFVPESSGSGVVITNGSVLTNAHVVTYEGVDGLYYIYDICIGGFSKNSYTSPDIDIIFIVDPNTVRRDLYFDYALLTAITVDATPYNFPSEVKYGNSDSLVHGDSITLIGYPETGGSTITSTQGSVSGFEYTNWIKSDAVAEFGNSGGGAFDSNGNLIGIPTLVVTGQLNSFTYISNLNAILEDILGQDLIKRDYDTLYSHNNVTCLELNCYQFGEGINSSLLNRVNSSTTQPAPNPIAMEPESSQYDSNQYNETLNRSVDGFILLQVEQHGEAWYMHPTNKKRYYMQNGPVAYQMMRKLSLGITDLSLADIPVVSSPAEMLTTQSVCKTNKLANRLRGQILLQVEQHGEAWYIYPKTCKRIYLKDGEAAYSIMRYLSLGITDADLKKIPSALLEL